MSECTTNHGTETCAEGPRDRLERKCARDVCRVGKLAHHALNDANVSIESTRETSRDDEAREGSRETEAIHADCQAEEAYEDDGFAPDAIGYASPVEDGDCLGGKEEALLSPPYETEVVFKRVEDVP